MAITKKKTFHVVKPLPLMHVQDNLSCTVHTSKLKQNRDGTFGILEPRQTLLRTPKLTPSSLWCQRLKLGQIIPAHSRLDTLKPMHSYGLTNLDNSMAHSLTLMQEYRGKKKKAGVKRKFLTRMFPAFGLHANVNGKIMHP